LASSWVLLATEKNASIQMNSPSHKNPYRNFRTHEKYYPFGQGRKHMKSATLK
jgi:hypothetical protein